MSQLRFLKFLILIYLLILQPSTIECRPHIQKIIIHGHEWTVPNEPGWENVLHEVEPIRYRLLSNCRTIHACRLAAERLREVFLKHPVSAKYYEDPIENNTPEHDGSSILNGDDLFGFYFVNV